MYVQVQRHLCSEDPQGVEGSSAFKGHQQGKGPEGITYRLEVLVFLLVCGHFKGEMSSLWLVHVLIACGPVRVCGHQNHRQHRLGYHAAEFHVCLHWSPTFQGGLNQMHLTHAIHVTTIKGDAKQNTIHVTCDVSLWHV